MRTIRQLKALSVLHVRAWVLQASIANAVADIGTQRLALAESEAEYDKRVRVLQHLRREIEIRRESTPVLTEALYGD